MNTITVKGAIQTFTLSEEEVLQLVQDNSFLEDAVLAILNPEMCDELPWTKGEYLYWLKDYFQTSSSYAKDFLGELFQDLPVEKPPTCYLDVEAA